MKHLLSFIAIIILVCSCKSYPEDARFENFEKELNEKSLKKVIDNSPLPFSNSEISDYKYFNYYKTFGNSGICVQFDITKDLEKDISTKLKDYERLKNSLLVHKDSNYVYSYSDLNNRNIKVPELSEEFGKNSLVNLTDDKQVEIYLIEQGKLKNTFVNHDSRNYNYSIGLYYFKESSTLIYWFLLY
jgi:hypothetical protein